MGYLQPLDPDARRIVTPPSLRTLLPEPMPAEDQQVQVELPGTPPGALLAAERPLERLERDQ